MTEIEMHCRGAWGGRWRRRRIQVAAVDSSLADNSASVPGRRTDSQGKLYYKYSHILTSLWLSHTLIRQKTGWKQQYIEKDPTDKWTDTLQKSN